jgi:hypothetical protein
VLPLAPRRPALGYRRLSAGNDLKVTGEWADIEATLEEVHGG